MMSGMSDVHRSVLKEQRVYLTDNLILSTVFMDHMISMHMLEEYMKEEIEGGKTKSEQRSKFLDILPKRGPNAFDNFLKALEGTGQKHIAEHLRNECLKKTDQIG